MLEGTIGTLPSNFFYLLKNFINEIKFDFFMSTFKEILDVEKKYSRNVDKAQKEHDKKLAKFKEDLLLKEEAIKQDYKKQLDEEFKKEVKDAKRVASENIEKAQTQAKHMETKAQIEKASQLIVDGVLKNV